MVKRLSGNVTDVKLLQPLNAFFLMVVTPFGMFTSVRADPSNAPEPIDFTLFGMVIDLSFGSQVAN